MRFATVESTQLCVALESSKIFTSSPLILPSTMAFCKQPGAPAANDSTDNISFFKESESDLTWTDKQSQNAAGVHMKNTLHSLLGIWTVDEMNLFSENTKEETMFVLAIAALAIEELSLFTFRQSPDSDFISAVKEDATVTAVLYEADCF